MQLLRRRLQVECRAKFDESAAAAAVVVVVDNDADDDGGALEADMKEDYSW